MGGGQLRPSLPRRIDRPSASPPPVSLCLPSFLSQPRGRGATLLACFPLERPGWGSGAALAFLRLLANLPFQWPSSQIITSEEAERRGQIYDRQGATYLFDLDYVEDVYTVDAAYYGNISHFVNHSVGTLQAGGGLGGAGWGPSSPSCCCFSPSVTPTSRYTTSS